MKNSSDPSSNHPNLFFLAMLVYLSQHTRAFCGRLGELLFLSDPIYFKSGPLSEKKNLSEQSYALC